MPVAAAAATLGAGTLHGERPPATAEEQQDRQKEAAAVDPAALRQMLEEQYGRIEALFMRTVAQLQPSQLRQVVSPSGSPGYDSPSCRGTPCSPHRHMQRRGSPVVARRSQITRTWPSATSMAAEDGDALQRYKSESRVDIASSPQGPGQSRSSSPPNLPVLSRRQLRVEMQQQGRGTLARSRSFTTASGPTPRASYIREINRGRSQPAISDVLPAMPCTEDTLPSFMASRGMSFCSPYSGNVSPGQDSNGTERERVVGTREWNATIRGQISSTINQIDRGCFHRTFAALPRKLRMSRHMDWLAGNLRSLSTDWLDSCDSRQTNCVEGLVDSQLFEVLSFVSIVANAAFIGLQQDWCTKDALRDSPQGCHTVLTGVNEVLVGIYAFEVLLRIAAKRARYFCGPHWKWNWFDFAFAVGSVVEVCLQLFSIAFLRILRVFRLVRLLRVLQAMRFLRLMIVSLTDSLASLSWAVLLLLLVMYLFSVSFMHAATFYLEHGSDHTVKEELEEHYGSMSRTMFTLVYAITNGVDWKVLADPLGEISVLYKLLFAFYVLFVLIGMMNVLTSTYVARVHELTCLDREHTTQVELAAREAFLTEMRRIFLELDTNKDGKIDWADFKGYLQSEQAQAYFATQQLDTSDAAGLFSLLKGQFGDGTGVVSVEEFALGCMRLRGQAKSSDVMMFMRENEKQTRRFMKEMRKLKRLLLVLSGDTDQMRAGSYTSTSYSGRGALADGRSCCARSTSSPPAVARSTGGDSTRFSI